MLGINSRINKDKKRAIVDMMVNAVAALYFELDLSPASFPSPYVDAPITIPETRAIASTISFTCPID